MRVLVVDDSPFMRKAVINSLAQTKYASYGIIEAGDGQEALKVYKTGAVDWVMCDWNMPKMNGLEFLIEARKTKTSKYIPIVMVTTEGTLGKMDEALTQGADRYVVKPFKAADLENAMDLIAQKLATKR